VYALPDAALANLAYFFDYDYAEPRDVRAYTRPVLDEVLKWQAAFPESGLYYVDIDDALWIWDLRPIAPSALVILEDLERSLYLACDGVRGVPSLVAQFARETGLDAAVIKAAIESLVDRKLMARVGDHVIGLAIARGAAAGSGEADAAPVAAAFQ
jgi:hypothetical protein